MSTATSPSPSKRQRTGSSPAESIAAAQAALDALDALNRAHLVSASLRAEASSRKIALELARAMSSTDRVDSLCASIVAPRQHDPDFTDFVALLFAAVFETKGAAEDAWKIVVALCASLGTLVGAAEFVAHSIVQLAAHSDETRASTSALLVWMVEDHAGHAVTVNSRHLGKLVVVTAIESNNEHLATAMMEAALSSGSTIEPATERGIACALMSRGPDPSAIAQHVTAETMRWVGESMLAVADPDPDPARAFSYNYARMIEHGNPFRPAVLHALRSSAVPELAGAVWARLSADCFDFSNPTSAASARQICAADTSRVLGALCALTVGSLLAPAAIETSEEALRLLYETYGSVPFVRAVDATGQLALLGIVSNNDTAALGVLFRCSRSDLARAAPIDAAKAHGSNGCLALVLAAYIRLVYAAPRAAPLMGLISRSFVSIEAGLLEPRVPNALCAEAENDDDCREVGKHFAARLLLLARAEPGLAFAPMFIDHVLCESRLRQDVARLHDGESDRYAYYVRAVAKTREGMHSLISEGVVVAAMADEHELRERINGRGPADVDVAPYA